MKFAGPEDQKDSALVLFYFSRAGYSADEMMDYLQEWALISDLCVTADDVPESEFAYLVTASESLPQRKLRSHPKDYKWPRPVRSIK